MTENYIRLNSDGTAQQVVTEISERDVTQDLINLMGSKSVRRCDNAFRYQGKQCGLLITGTETYGYLQLHELELNTSFKLYGDKIMRPVFLRAGASPKENDENPAFAGRWSVPGDMRLVFAARIFDSATDSPYTQPTKACYLVAFDDQRRAFQLPLPNLYDGCDLCMGDFNGLGDSCASAFAKACDQMCKSKWNTDLFDANKASSCDALFHFKPTKDAIQSVPAGTVWTQHCKKRVTPTLETLSQII